MGQCPISNVKTEGVAPMHGISACKEFWKENLESIEDQNLAQKVIKYVHERVPIEHKGEISQIEEKNWPSTEEYSEEVDAWVRKHRKNGAIEGPYEIGKGVDRTSPLGAFLKKGKNLPIRQRLLNKHRINIESIYLR